MGSNRLDCGCPHHFLGMAFSPQPEWQQIHPEHIPPTRAVASLVYNPSTQKAVLFGGTVFTGNAWVDLNDTWVWDGTDWLQINSSYISITSPVCCLCLR